MHMIQGVLFKSPRFIYGDSLFTFYFLLFNIYFHCGDSGDRNAPVKLVKIAPSIRSGTGYDFVPIP
jgi:hypothetical protein